MNGKVIEDNSTKRYVILKTLGRGAFGTVYLTHLENAENEVMAIKQTPQDPRYKNREGDILKLLSFDNHQGIIEIFDIFYSERKQDLYLNVVMEYFPETLHDLI